MVVMKNLGTCNNDNETNNSDQCGFAEDKDPLYQPKTEQIVAKGRGRPRKTGKKAASSVEDPIEKKVNNMQMDLKNLAYTMKQSIANLEATVNNMQQHNQVHSANGDPKTHFQQGIQVDQYKDMFMESQKENTNLKIEKLELEKKLEIAHAKMEGYEMGQKVIAQSLANFRDAYLISEAMKNTNPLFGSTPVQKTEPPEPSEKKNRRRATPRRVAPPASMPSPPPVPPKCTARKNTRNVVEDEGTPAGTRRKVSGDTIV